MRLGIELVVGRNDSDSLITIGSCFATNSFMIITGTTILDRGGHRIRTLKQAATDH